ncbi:MAG: hypothetical protein WC582_03630 [Patescibacteria group bacterium]
MKNNGKKFHLGDILSITTGKLVSPKGMDGIYDILNYMSGDTLFTHQLPRVSEECKPKILEQHPQLNDIDASPVNSETYKQWLAEQVAKYGEYLEIQPLPSGSHESKNPIEELEDKIGKEKIIVVGK